MMNMDADLIVRIMEVLTCAFIFVFGVLQNEMYAEPAAVRHLVSATLPD